MTGLELSLIRELFRKVYSSNAISLAGGSPDLNTLPLESLPKITEDAINKYGPLILQYGQTEGFPPLKKALLPLLTNRGLKISDDDIFITSGAQAALSAATMALIDPGDRIAVESPTFLGALKTFKSYQAQLVPLEVDEEGITMSSLSQSVGRIGVKFVYLVPTFQNPTGRSMSLRRKIAVAEFAIHNDLLIIEDDPYYELRYSGQNIPTLYSLAPNNVLYIGSLSKIFSPGVRLGYFIGPKKLCDAMVSLKQGIDLHASVYSQALAAEYIAGGYLQKHLKKIKQIYKLRLQTMSSIVAREFPDSFSFSKPEGGMFLWIEGPQGFDANQFHAKALESGVAFVPGKPFFSDQRGDNYLRLSFTNVSEKDISAALIKLAKILKNQPTI